MCNKIDLLFFKFSLIRSTISRTTNSIEMWMHVVSATVYKTRSLFSIEIVSKMFSSPEIQFSSLLRLCASYLDRSKVFEHIVIAQNNKKIYLWPSNAIEKCQRLRMTRLGLKESRRETGAGTSFFLLLLSQCSCYFQFFFFSFSASAAASASSVVIHH